MWVVGVSKRQKNQHYSWNNEHASVQIRDWSQLHIHSTKQFTRIIISVGKQELNGHELNEWLATTLHTHLDFLGPSSLRWMSSPSFFSPPLAAISLPMVLTDRLSWVRRACCSLATKQHQSVWRTGKIINCELNFLSWAWEMAMFDPLLLDCGAKFYFWRTKAKVVTHPIFKLWVHWIIVQTTSNYEVREQLLYFFLFHHTLTKTRI